MRINIYLPDAMQADLAALPPRTVSQICQDAIRQAAASARRERDDMITHAFEED